MLPVVSTDSTTYQNLFGIVTVPLWVLVAIMAVGALLTAFCLFVFTDAKKVTTRAVSIAAIGLVIAACWAVLGTYAGQRDTLHDHLSANLQHKYGVTLDSSFNDYLSDNELSHNMPYMVVLSDGTKASYSFRFDRTTSEPFIINIPTPDKLEQDAKK